MSLFAAIQRSFESLRAAGEFDGALGRWSQLSDTLSLFRDADELIHVVGRSRDCDSSGDWLADALLAALCSEASRGVDIGAKGAETATGPRRHRRSRAADDAALLILWLFLPQLWGTSFANPGGALDRDDLEAEMAVGLWEVVVAVGPDDAGVARRLIRGARDTARAAARRALDYERRCRTLASAEHMPAPDAGWRRLVDTNDIVAMASRLEVVNELEARLILETRFDGIPLDRTGHALGLSTKAAEMRRARAESRLLAWLNDGSIPPRRDANARRRFATALLNTSARDLGTATGPSSSGAGSRKGGDEDNSPGRCLQPTQRSTGDRPRKA